MTIETTQGTGTNEKDREEDTPDRVAARLGGCAPADARKEKADIRAGDVLAAERRRMPWMEVEEQYQFDGPNGGVSLLDLFEGRKQLILYRAFSNPEFSDGPTMPAAAALWAPIRCRTWHT